MRNVAPVAVAEQDYAPGVLAGNEPGGELYPIRRFKRDVLKVEPDAGRVGGKNVLGVIDVTGLEDEEEAGKDEIGASDNDNNPDTQHKKPFHFRIIVVSGRVIVNVPGLLVARIAGGKGAFCSRPQIKLVFTLWKKR